MFIPTSKQFAYTDMQMWTHICRANFRNCDLLLRD